MPNRAVEGATAPVLATPCKDGQRRRRHRTGGTMHLDTPATENAERHATKLTKRHLVKSFWVLIVPFLFPSALAAEPSLAETIQYIEAKINEPDSRQVYFRLNGGNVTFRRDYWDGESRTITFQLGALSTTVDAWERGVDVSCARGLCISIMRDYPNDDHDTIKTTGEIFIPVKTQDVERVQKALTHAIELSGGKDELF